MKCQYCGFELPQDAVFCNACGNKQASSKQCAHCGTLSPPSTNFCISCGKPFPPETVTPMASTPMTKKEKPQKGASFLIAIILAFFLAGAMTVMIAFGILMTKEKANVQWYMNENDILQNKLRDAQNEMEEIQAFLDTDFIIKIKDIYNSDSNGNQITSSMYANQMRYLHIDYEILWISKNSPASALYIDIYAPDGTMSRNHASSPYGHTMTAYLSEGSHGTGWGNSSTSTYQSGEYTINFVYENKILCSQKITIK